MTPIIEKLQKLQALASNAGTEAEAAVAMLRVQELLAKHNRDIGVLQFQKEEGTQASTGPCNPRMPNYYELLARACDEVLNVRHFLERTSRRGWQYCFVGLEANVEAARVTFSWLIESVESLLEGWKKRPPEGLLFAQYRRRDYDEFRLGAAVSIKSRATTQGIVTSFNAELVHVGNSVATRMMEKTNPRHRKMKLTLDPRVAAFRDGYNEGSRVDFHGARKSRMVTGGKSA